MGITMRDTGPRDYYGNPGGRGRELHSRPKHFGGAVRNGGYAGGSGGAVKRLLQHQLRQPQRRQSVQQRGSRGSSYNNRGSSYNNRGNSYNSGSRGDFNSGSRNDFNSGSRGSSLQRPRQFGSGSSLNSGGSRGGSSGGGYTAAARAAAVRAARTPLWQSVATKTERIVKSMKIVALCAAFVAAAPLQAQNTGLEFGGSVLNHDMLWATDLAQLSQTHVFGTARVMGGGGAFASLGADLSSMSLNPAGLGMYRRNEISLHAARAHGEGIDRGNGLVEGQQSQFAFANVGVALNVFEFEKLLTSLTLGIGTNRIADFSPLLVFVGIAYDPDRPDRLMPTIADIFSQQMNNFGVRPDHKPMAEARTDRFPSMRGIPMSGPAIMAYDAYMLGNTTER